MVFKSGDCADHDGDLKLLWALNVLTVCARWTAPAALQVGGGRNRLGKIYEMSGKCHAITSLSFL